MKCKLIKNFLTKEEINLCTDYCRIQHRQNKSNFDNQNSNLDSSFYADPLMESMLLNKRKLVEKHSKLKFLKYYSYFRVYTYKSDLPKHTDRPSCEISVTVHINSDGTPWEIYAGDKKYRTKNGPFSIYCFNFICCCLCLQ